jgi:peptide/nickel transport system ATP-binding protein
VKTIDPLLVVRGVRKRFESKRRVLSLHTRGPAVTAVDGVDLDLWPGEIVALVGESGCGKTTLGNLITGLVSVSEGTLTFGGEAISGASARRIRRLRRRMQMVFQDPFESVNPRFTVYQTVLEPLINFKIGAGKEDRRRRVLQALGDAGLHPADAYLHRFPHELSGGQLQRVAIARAIVVEPSFIVADEPVSMLDVSIRAGVMNLLLDLRERFGLAYLFVTHDMAVARYMADRIAVMYLGKIVEIGPADEVIGGAFHPYTQALLSAVPDADPDVKHGRVTIRDDAPLRSAVTKGCRFHPRCPRAQPRCHDEQPPLIEHAPGHKAACFFPGAEFAGRPIGSTARPSPGAHPP